MTFKLKGGLVGITPERAERMINVINAMQVMDMSIIEISAAADMSKSGGRKYIKDLVQHDIIKHVGFAEGKTKMLFARPMYGLNPDNELIKAFVTAITAPNANGKARCRGQKPFGAIHVMQDDAVFKVKRAPWKLPEHTELMSLFFGMNNNTKEVA